MDFCNCVYDHGFLSHEPISLLVYNFRDYFINGEKVKKIMNLKFKMKILVVTKPTQLNEFKLSNQLGAIV